MAPSNKSLGAGADIAVQVGATETESVELLDPIPVVCLLKLCILRHLDLGGGQRTLSRVHLTLSLHFVASVCRLASCFNFGVPVTGEAGDS